MSEDRTVKEGHFSHHFGAVNINAPKSVWVMASSALFVVLMIIAFICFAKVSEKNAVKGYLDSSSRVISVESDVAGLVSEVRVEEGTIVHKGDILFVVSNPNHESTSDHYWNIKRRLNNVKSQYQIGYENYKALKKLQAKGYVSISNFRSAKANLFALQTRVKEIENELLNFTESRYRQVRATADGVVTNVLYGVGQKIQDSKPLLQILPKESELIVRIYVPSRNIAFLKKGQKISIQYDAYPFQRFGTYQAIIEEIGRTVLIDEQEEKPIKIGEPYYKVKARLTNQHVVAYGKKIPLSHGITLTANVSGGKKKVWQWLIDPIYSFRGY